jgi:hypothetical protein
MLAPQRLQGPREKQVVHPSYRSQGTAHTGLGTASRWTDMSSYVIAAPEMTRTPCTDKPPVRWDTCQTLDRLHLDRPARRDRGHHRQAAVVARQTALPDAVA